MPRRRAVLLALALAGGGSRAAAAPFEGVVEGRLVEERGGRPAHGRLTFWLAPAGARAELAVPGDGPPTREVLFRRERPGVAWRLAGARAIAESLAGPAPGRLTVGLLGTEEVAGLPCQHARVRASGGGLRLEVWLAPALDPADPAWALGAWGRGPWRAVGAALGRAGARGWPLRWVRRDGGVTVRWEATRVAAVPVDPARLAFPARAPGPSLLTPEQEQLLEERARERGRQRLPRPDAPAGEAR